MDKFLQVCRSPFASGFFLIMTLLMVSVGNAVGAASMAFIAGITLQRLGQARQRL
ncbi:hypothetical protein [Croceicoccus marinus]|uniref:Uncharacterized protein n=1 Tax=Croceicoccus marinus TaxID=450378 RepID=A0A7G6W183_9SPHN|nr:hypothetical protein [Croceicoccus marinus]QNE07748.1 hypothetical protein H4O24_20235 [Croceicoccus marinus]